MPEAGWYADPGDPTRLRRWDGDGWTDETRPAVDAATPGGGWWRHPATWIGVVVVVALVVAAVVVLPGDDAGAEVILEPTTSAGDDPFMDSVATTEVAVEGGEVEQVSGGDDSVEAVEGSAPGLYGGTGEEAVCDPEAMLAFLEESPAKAEAFASVQGIDVGGIADFVAGLTPLVLREDTRVTNHGFAQDRATPFQSVLQAGTAVMVDDRGVPRVRCACGNPLAEPTPTDAAPDFTGAEWDGFDRDRLIAVSAGEQVEAFQVVDVETGELLEVPVGSGGAGEIVLARDGLGVVPFGASEDETLSVLTGILGPPSRDVEVFCVSGSDEKTRTVRWGSLEVYLGSESGFYLWDYGLFDVPGSPDQGLTTPEGLGQGATLQDLEATYGVARTYDDPGTGSPAVHYVDDRFVGYTTPPGMDGLLAASAPVSEELLKVRSICALPF